MSRTAQRLIVGATREDLDVDEKLQLARVRALQTVAEAAGKTSDAFQAAHPALPWKQIAGFRHRAVHDHFDIDNRVVRLIATTELQPIINLLEPLAPPRSTHRAVLTPRHNADRRAHSSSALAAA